MGQYSPNKLSDQPEALSKIAMDAYYLMEFSAA